jgi:SAM-dependent methyltransferase
MVQNLMDQTISASASERPRVHPAEWSAAQIASFWDNYASIPHLRARFFSLTCGEGILEFAERFVPSQDLFLDYGCGQGDLMQVLLARGRHCMGLDSSPENVRSVTQRFAGNAGFLGAFSSAEPQRLPATPNTVMLVEVIEHMPRSAAVDFLRGVAALLPAGGHIVVTCPNREDIVRAEVLCPQCGCCFHPVQHMQSLAPDEVAALADSAGFDTVHAGATRFRRKGELRIKNALIAAWYSLVRRSPHLVYIGRKR